MPVHSNWAASRHDEVADPDPNKLWLIKSCYEIKKSLGEQSVNNVYSIQ